jgi:DNA-binding NtrC family response regulator
VRELESAVEHAALRARGDEVTPDNLPAKLQSPEIRAASHSPLTALYGDLPSLAELERRYLIHVLDSMSGNRSRAAEIMGIDRRTLYRMAERYGIKLDGD